MRRRDEKQGSVSSEHTSLPSATLNDCVFVVDRAGFEPTASALQIGTYAPFS